MPARNIPGQYHPYYLFLGKRRVIYHIIRIGAPPSFDYEDASHGGLLCSMFLLLHWNLLLVWQTTNNSNPIMQPSQETKHITFFAFCHIRNKIRTKGLISSNNNKQAT
jgi:hypothetical protein